MMPNIASPASTHLYGRWLAFARGIWFAMAAYLAVEFLLDVLGPVFFSTPFVIGLVLGGNPNNESLMPALQYNHIAIQVYDIFQSLVGAGGLLLCVGLAVLLFWRNSNERISLLTSLFFLCLGMTSIIFYAPAHLGAVETFFNHYIFTDIIFLLWGVFFVTFPDGHMKPQWTIIPGCALLVQAILFQLPGASNITHWPVPIFIIELFTAYFSPVLVFFYRYARIFTVQQRTQARWLLLSFATLLMVVFGGGLLGTLPPFSAPTSWYQLVEGMGVQIVLILPIGVVIAVTRYRLWDIDVLINRTLVYSSLSAILAAIYVGSVIGLQAMIRSLMGQDSALAIVAATLLIAALFQPLRQRIQATIDQRFFRQKYDTAQVLDRFSATLRTEVELDQLTANLVSVVRETMQPTHVTLWLRSADLGREASPRA